MKFLYLKKNIFSTQNQKISKTKQQDAQHYAGKAKLYFNGRPKRAQYE